MKFYIFVFFENLSIKFRFHYNRTRTAVLYMKTNIHVLSYLAQFFLEWEMFRTNVVGKIKTHIVCSITFFPENRTVCEITWENVVEWGRPQMTAWRMRIACWIPKPTNTHSHYVILIAFPLQQWLHESTTLLRYTHCTVSVLLT